MRLEDLDTPTLIVDLDALEENLGRYQQQAFALLTSEATRRAFDIRAEPDPVR